MPMLNEYDVPNQLTEEEIEMVKQPTDIYPNPNMWKEELMKRLLKHCISLVHFTAKKLPQDIKPTREVSKVLCRVEERYKKEVLDEPDYANISGTMRYGIESARMMLVPILEYDTPRLNQKACDLLRILCDECIKEGIYTPKIKK